MILIFKLFNCSGMQDEEGNQFVAYFTPTEGVHGEAEGGG